MIDETAVPPPPPARVAGGTRRASFSAPVGSPVTITAGDGVIARPYLERSPDDVGLDPAIDEAVGVRPYYVTRGRTTSSNEAVTFETVVTVAAHPSPYVASLKYEERALVELCAEPQSIVEISAKLRLPIAVAKVLAGDLAAFGVLEVFSPPDDVLDDIALIDTVIDGLRQL